MLYVHMRVDERADEALRQSQLEFMRQQVAGCSPRGHAATAPTGRAIYGDLPLDPYLRALFGSSASTGGALSACQMFEGGTVSSRQHSHYTGERSGMCAGWVGYVDRGLYRCSTSRPAAQTSERLHVDLLKRLQGTGSRERLIGGVLEPRAMLVFISFSPAG